MKTSILIILGLALTTMGAQGQVVNNSNGGSQPDAAPAPTARRVVERGANHRVWQWETYERSPGGIITTSVHKYTELATGLNYTNSYGQLTESKEQITILPTGGAAATQGQHKVYFPADIYNGVLEVITPDGKHLRSRPVGISYDDGSNSVFIATLKDALGYLTSSNQVTYRDAFTNFRADLVCTYRRGGFESDVVFRQQPPTPDQYGLDNASSTLQMITEFFNTQDPQEIPTGSDDGYGLQDSTLKFGELTMTQGKAFAIGSPRPVGQGEGQTPVYKRWLHLDDRTFLVEEVPLEYLADDLDALPLTASVQKLEAGSLMAALRSPSSGLHFPPSHGIVADTNQILLASADFNREPGVVLDYVTFINTTNYYNYTFQGDTTYYISGNVNFTGSSTVAGGAVLKYAPGAQLIFNYPPAWQASAYRPVIFTAKDDNTVGETISGSTGNPTSYSSALVFGYSPTTISNFRISYAGTAITLNMSGSPVFSNGQLVNCGTGFNFAGGGINLANRNMLFVNVYTPFNIPYYGGSYPGVDVQNTTFSGCSSLYSSGYYGSVSLKNCILANVGALTYGTNFTLSGTTNGFYKCPKFGTGTITNTFNPFQTTGAGAYYLTNGCNFLNAGTTNIDATLLASLKTLTTYAPQDGGWPDTNAPDLGYHYPVTTVHAASCSFVDVSNAVAAASPGWTVILPPGTNSWSDTLTVSGITLQGSGTNNTVIVDESPTNGPSGFEGAPVIQVYTTDSALTRITQLQIALGVTNRPPFQNFNGSVLCYGSSPLLRIDNCFFNNLDSKPIRIGNQINGLVDHCTFFMSGLAVIPIELDGTSGSDPYGDVPWSHTYTPGTSNALYMEDCYIYFNQTGWDFTTPDVSRGGIMVFRHNTVINGYFNTHGAETSQRYRSARFVEVYQNYFAFGTVAGGYFQNGVDIRGSSGLIWSNVFDGFGNSYIPGDVSLHYYRAKDNDPGFTPWFGATGTNGWDTNSTLLASGKAIGGATDGYSYTQLIATNVNWATNQWIGYTVLNTNTLLMGLVSGNTSNTITFMASRTWYSWLSFQVQWSFNDAYQVYKVYQGIDQPGAGPGDLLSGYNPTPVWLNQTHDPVWQWGDQCRPIYGSGNYVAGGIYPTLNVTDTNGWFWAGRDYTNSATAKPGYVPFTYPHPTGIP